eukprot:c11522_g1_i3.p1 GENE.c11522_g1_i3~~c11522_g1_i3.p1  ORF type:complete len:261 (+),score=56.78 c11522_g1_i3:712-1494(+)
MGLMVLTLFRILNLESKHRQTRNVLLACVGCKLLWDVKCASHESVVGTDVFAMAMTLATLTNMLVVVRMGECNFELWLTLLCVVWFLPRTFAFVIATAFHLLTLTVLCSITRLSPFSPICNVYVDGVYDLCHVGHMVAFQNALKHGNRLFVGVCSDEDVARYKRNPIMTTQERIAVVSACQGVFKVIMNAPCTKGALDEAFIREHNIHIVCLGEEYDNPEDQWYAIPRRMGMVRILPRYQGLSTSDLIRRIKSRIQENTL